MRYLAYLLRFWFCPNDPNDMFTLSTYWIDVSKILKKIDTFHRQVDRLDIDGLSGKNIN